MGSEGYPSEKPVAANPLPDPYEVPSGKVARGVGRVPPSKSIAHRALILAALAEGASRVAPLPHGEDVAATLDCLRALGVKVGGGQRASLRIEE